ncbi:MAG: 23S rRNA (uracil(1939)-C(5))-methyltransferase RlmD [Lachnospiraceae bacterium]|nr:23S rRNA (uracil(1939)-C(5))-methyltransferase RlmD [Lachnospiraceae bacterium]
MRDTEKKDKNNRRGFPSKKKSGKSSGACPIAEQCGGCAYQHLSYEEQCACKEQQVKQLIGDICKVEPMMRMEHPYHYRNKVSAAFAHKRDNTIISGVYAQGTHKVIPVDECLIEDRKADQIICDIRGLLKSFKIKIYSEDSGYGLLRHVLIRRGFASGQILVVLVTVSPIFPSKNNFVKALRKLHPEITSIVLNVNDKDTSMVLGTRNIPIYGKGFIEDTLCGCVFRISPTSFYQINPVQTERIYQKAIELAGLTGEERVLDAYCGIGTIGLIASKKAKEVLGVELNPDAVRDARANAKRNNITNTTFFQGDAGEVMVQMAEQQESIDVVFMDPPRAGSDEAFLSSIVKLQPKKVVYISCNPQTLARDLEYLKKQGYRAKSVIPADMFPWSAHTEVICSLSRTK